MFITWESNCTDALLEKTFTEHPFVHVEQYDISFLFQFLVHHWNNNE